MVTNEPKLTDLYKLIKKVPKYPITAQQLVDFAAATNAGTPIIHFYRSFPSYMTFYDEDDLAGRSEQVEILKQEEVDQPPEGLTVSEED
jgi:hypothetical protein